MHVLQMTNYAMGTSFELRLFGKSEAYLTGVGEAIFAEIERLEAQLSLYRDESDLTDINARAAQEPVYLDPRLFRLLERAQTIWERTEGAFDITVAPLMECWGFLGATGQKPSEEAIQAARARVGMQWVHLDPENYTVSFEREGVRLDLGAIGKGYAIEQAVEILQEMEIERALIHGGASSIYALGSPPEEDSWRIAIQKPFDAEGSYVGTVELKDSSLSVSAPHRKWFESEGRRYGHVIDPRTGVPAGNAVLSAVVTPSPTDGDALSTALLTLGADGIPVLQAVAPHAQTLVGREEAGKLYIATYGSVWNVQTDD